MRVTIFGASGGVGRRLVEQARERGHAVRAVYRRRPAEVPAGVEVTVADDVLSVIEEATGDADVVLSALGLRRRWPSNPWSRITSPPDLTSSFAAAVVEALAWREPSPRVIVVSAAGVGDSRVRMSGMLRAMFDHSKIGVAYRDLDRMEQTLAASRLDWIAVRPTTLSNARTIASRETNQYRLTDSIPRAAVAGWMLDHLDDAIPATRTPMITRAP